MPTVVTATRNAGSGTLQGTTTATAVNGIVTFSTLNHTVATTITINFTATGLTSNWTLAHIHFGDAGTGLAGRVIADIATANGPATPPAATNEDAG